MLGLLELGNTGSQETGVGEKNTRQFRWITVYDLLRHIYDVRRAPRRAQSAVMPVRVNGAGQLTVFAWMLFNCRAVNVRMVGSGRRSRTGVSTADAMIFVPRAAT
jgi:hypothetical protein